MTPSDLRAQLDAIAAQVDLVQQVQNDPVWIVRGYPDAADREVVALVAACLAYGRVSLIQRSLRACLAPLGAHPAQTLARPDYDHGATLDALATFKHRMASGQDVAWLYFAVHKVLRADGSLWACFARHDDPADEDYLKALTGLVAELYQHVPHKTDGFRHLLVDPRGGSACKRLNLFMRWVVRGPDEVDVGLWTQASPARLTIAVDTHIARIAQTLGLSQRRTPDWRMAREITARLGALDPDDPLRYDFPLCHYGVLGHPTEGLGGA